MSMRAIMPPSKLEATMALQIRAHNLPAPETEFRFHPIRRWRFDFAWSELKIALEINGGTWSQGRHSRGTGQTNDAQKGNTAQLMGWVVLTATSDMVKSGEAIKAVLEAMGKT
jgi:very-short-patch-repair endonuclease